MGPFFLIIYSFSHGAPRDCFVLDFWGRNSNAYFIKENSFFSSTKVAFELFPFSRRIGWENCQSVSCIGTLKVINFQKRFKMDWSWFSNTFFSGTTELTSTFKVLKTSYLCWNFNRQFFTGVNRQLFTLGSIIALKIYDFCSAVWSGNPDCPKAAKCYERRPISIFHLISFFLQLWPSLLKSEIMPLIF